MGKSIIAQRRGKGSKSFRIPPGGQRFIPQYKPEKGVVVDILHDLSRDAPIAKIKYTSGEDYMVAYKGLRVGDTSDNFGVALSKIPESSPIYGLETYPNSGPKMCLTPGSFAIILSKTEKNCVVQLPSKKTKVLNLTCRATIGVPAGEGRDEKPWVKAGKKFHAMEIRGKMYPRSGGVKMNPVNHPFGGSTGPGGSMSISRHAPPGAKVGAIASRRTGKRRAN